MKITKFFFVFLGIVPCFYAQSQTYVINFLETQDGPPQKASLTVNSKYSLYQTIIPNAKIENSEKVTQSGDMIHKDVTIGVDHGKVYPEFNFRNQLIGTLLSQRNLGLSDYALVEEIIPKINWKIFDEEKMIADTYRCKKAVGKFRGRTYTVWFAEEIPISSGPWKLGGLPGLILEAEEDEQKYAFHFSSLKRLDQEDNIENKVRELKVVPDEKPISWMTFKSDLKQRIEDMKRLFLSRMRDKYGDNVELTSTKVEMTIREKSILEEDDKK